MKVGYLYEAIAAGWKLTIPQPSVSGVLIGFRTWFDQAKAQGLVLAAMTIDGVHHTLHAVQGWLPTSYLMQSKLW